MLSKVIAAILIGCGVVSLIFQATSRSAYAQTNEDLARQSKYCEAATRLPWGDVDANAWSDCVEFKTLRSLEERKKPGPVNSPWAQMYLHSTLAAVEQGCWASASRKPPAYADPCSSGRANCYIANQAFNECMERAGIFEHNKQRPPSSGTITFKFPRFAYACKNEADRRHIADQVFARLESGQFGGAGDLAQYAREIASHTRGCKYWLRGDTGVVEQKDGNRICVSSPEKPDDCYWTDGRGFTLPSFPLN